MKTPKEFLGEYRNSRRESKTILDSIETLQATLESTAAPQLKEDVTHNAFLRDKQSELIIKKLELEEKLLDRYSATVNLHEQIEQVIDAVPSAQERIVLRMRYIQGMKWEEICTTMYISWRQVHYIHARALQSVDKILKDCTQLHT